MGNPLRELHEHGQSPWYDGISRSVLASGELDRMIEEDGLCGAASDPASLEAAVSGSSDYDDAIRAALQADVRDPQAVFERIAVLDVREACDRLAPVYERSSGADGYASLAVSPHLAYDTRRTVGEAERLCKAVDRPNVMIRVPATREGLEAFQRLVSKGVSVHATLIFAIDRCVQVMDAYLTGLESLGGGLSEVASAAGFSVGRIDAAVDERLAAGRKDHPLIGKAAVASAKVAYQTFQERFSAERFEKLRKKGARVQRLVWACPDVLQAGSLIGPDTAGSFSPDAWSAFRDRGRPADTLAQDVGGALKTLKELEAAGVKLDRIANGLEKTGVESLVKSYESLMDSIAGKVRGLSASRRDLPISAGGSMAQDIVSKLWKKDVSLWARSDAAAKNIAKSLGWLDMPEQMPKRVEEITRFADDVRKAGFTDVMVLGMGGSSLAPEVMRQAFGPQKGSPTLRVLDSTEPETVAAARSWSDPKKTLYIVASKSGTTTEPLRFMDYFWAATGEDGGNFAAVTDPDTKMEEHAKKNGFRKVFLNYADIGGRFSALSFFGMVPAGLAGYDVKGLLGRAAEMADACRPGKEDNPGYALGTWMAEHAKRGCDKLTFLVSPEIASFGLWLEQLLAESTGKEGRGVVPVTGEAVMEPGRYSPDRVFIHIKLRGSKDSSLDKAVEALGKAGRPTLTLTLKDTLDLGAEFFRWEVATAVLGQALGINPFDQPDVQAAKDKTKALLKELSEKGELPEPERHVEEGGVALSFSKAAKKSSGSLKEALGAFVASARPNDYAGVLAYLASDGRYDPALKGLHGALAAATGIPVQSGYGPRYLHSTGQLHKGGPNTGLFLLLARTDAADVMIPGADYSFRPLVSAQALGDFQALDSAGRRAVLIRITGDAKKVLKKISEAVSSAKSLKV